MGAGAWEEKEEGLKREDWRRKTLHFEDWAVALCKLHYKVEFKIVGALIFFPVQFVVSNVCDIVLWKDLEVHGNNGKKASLSRAVSLAIWAEKEDIKFVLLAWLPLEMSFLQLCVACVKVYMPLTFLSVGWFQLNLMET